MKRAIVVMGLALWAVSGAWSADAPKQDDSDWRWDIGADNRLRYELMDRFQADKDDSRNVFFNRARVHAGVTYVERATVFVEGLDAREWTHDAPEAGQEDDCDLHQAYLELAQPFDSPLRVKAGRQLISYGASRILGASTWGNKIRSFDAAIVGLKSGRLSSDIFFGNPVTYESGFNSANDDEKLSGLYNVVCVSKASSLDVYAVRKENPLAGSTNATQDRYTTGLRLSAKSAGGAGIDAETAYQFGEDGNKDVSAYALSCRIERKFGGKLAPKLSVEGNLASGDSDPADDESRAFIPPCQTTHGPYGIIDFFRWQNMRELAVSGGVTLAPKLTAQSEAHAYWLDKAADAWRDSSGRALRAASAKNRDTYTGSELSLVVKHDPNKRLGFEAGYSAFLSGDVADDVSDEDVVHYGYAQVVVKQ